MRKGYEENAFYKPTICSIKSINVVRRKNGLECLKGSKYLSVKRTEAASLFIRMSEATVILQLDISFDLYLFCLKSYHGYLFSLLCFMVVACSLTLRLRFTECSTSNAS